MTILFFHPHQLRSLLVVVLLPRDAFDLGFDVIKQIVHLDRTIRLNHIFIFDSFEQKIGEEAVAFFIIG